MKERIAHVAEAGGLSLSDASMNALSAWLDLLEDWNRRMDLTAARGEDELADLMLADAVLLACRVPVGASVVDVGSGAGAPGLPLAMLRSDLDVTLVEPRDKRVAFLRTVLGTVWPASGTDAIAVCRPPTVLRSRGQDLVRRGLRFGVALSRATLPPADWLALGTRLAPQGQVWLLLAREQPPAQAGWAVKDDIGYRWPLTAAERRAVRLVPLAGAKEDASRRPDDVVKHPPDPAQGGKP